jgi:hypothetical protein
VTPEQRNGTGGAVWDALLANLDEEDRAHAQERVWQSIENDRARALTSDEGDGDADRGDGTHG